MIITIEHLDKWDACCREYGRRYSDVNLSELLNGRPGLTALEVLRLDIQVGDRIWVVLRPEVIGRDMCEQFSDMCVNRGVKKYVLNCGILQVESWGRDWLNGNRNMTTTRAASVTSAGRAIAASYVASSAVAAIRNDCYWVLECVANAECGAANITKEHQWQLDKLIELLEKK